VPAGGPLGGRPAAGERRLSPIIPQSAEGFKRRVQA